MTFNILDAVAAIKRNVANCLTAKSIEGACQAENYRWRERELGPVATVHAFITQVLHGNTACTHAVRLAGLNCSAEAYCQARARLPLAVYERLSSKPVRPRGAVPRCRCGTGIGPSWWTDRASRWPTRRSCKRASANPAGSGPAAVFPRPIG